MVGNYDTNNLVKSTTTTTNNNNDDDDDDACMERIEKCNPQPSHRISPEIVTTQATEILELQCELSVQSEKEYQGTEEMMRSSMDQTIVPALVSYEREEQAQHHHDFQQERSLTLPEPPADAITELSLQIKIRESQSDLKVERMKHQQEMQRLNETIRRQQLSHQNHVRELEERICRLSEKTKEQMVEPTATSSFPDRLSPVSKLTPQHIARYSRQLLLHDGFGVEGQSKLLSSSVLVVGAGGIGSTVLLYLAASGIGRISVADFDNVDMSNLHRQVIHTEAHVGMNKAVSACRAIKALNPTIECAAIEAVLTHENALDVISRHDVIVDASDNPRTRYLINDACVLAGKPLISGSAMGTEGQLTVYNHLGGPCYRCIYPKPNAAEGCKSCSDSGVLGPVPGLIGVLQSLEVLKVLTGCGDAMHDRMLMYDSLNCSFTNIKKPPKSKKCPVCSESAKISSMQDSLEISISTRGPSEIPSKVADVPLAQSVSPLPISMVQHISCQDYNAIRNRGTPHVLLDVRVPRQFDICRLDGAINIPLDMLPEALSEIEALGSNKPIYCICRRGIFSVEASRVLSEAMERGLKIHSVKNVVGGLTAWADEVDTSFPKY